jgi:hypothetical protein
MTKTYDFDGEQWRAYLGEDPPHPGLLPLIFHCTSNSSHGWRVVEVSDREYASDADLEALEDAKVEALFRRAKPFDHPHDPKATENRVGRTPLR